MPRVSFRNLRRWTFATIAIASLILCLATVGLWVRSYWARDRFVYSWEVGGELQRDILIVYRGHLLLVMMSKIDPNDVADGFGWEVKAPENVSRAFVDARSPSFVFESFSDGMNVPFTSFTRAVSPHWSLALLFAIVPAWWGMAIVRARRRSPPGCCVNCGYDLRASPGRCPECGAAAAS